jgi:hypothetical protein
MEAETPRGNPRGVLFSGGLGRWRNGGCNAESAKYARTRWQIVNFEAGRAGSAAIDLHFMHAHAARAPDDGERAPVIPMSPEEPA